MAEVNRSGQYKKAKARGYKVAGLTRKEMGKATTLKGKALTKRQRAKASELKDISQTRWEKGKGVVGPGGKAFTGTVTLASGKTASYVKGRRVGVGPKPKASGSATGGSKGGTPKTPGAKPKPALSMSERKKMQEGRKNWQSGSRRTGQDALSSSERKKLQERMRGNKSTVTIPGGTTITLSGQGGSSKKGPKKGDRRRVSPFSTQMETYNGTRWVKDPK